MTSSFLQQDGYDVTRLLMNSKGAVSELCLLFPGIGPLTVQILLIVSFSLVFPLSRNSNNGVSITDICELFPFRRYQNIYSIQSQRHRPSRWFTIVINFFHVLIHDHCDSLFFVDYEFWILLRNLINHISVAVCVMKLASVNTQPLALGTKYNVISVYH